MDYVDEPYLISVCKVSLEREFLQSNSPPLRPDSSPFLIVETYPTLGWGPYQIPTLLKSKAHQFPLNPMET